MTNFDRVYWEITGLTPSRLNSEDEKVGDSKQKDLWAIARKAALSRAHEIRKFEIELYWKRAAHFWLLQAAVFTAIGLSWSRFSDGLSPFIPVALAALGSVTARAGHLSAMGSKFWQENWEYHIDKLEDEFEGRLHKTAYVGEDGISYSVSRINEQLAQYLVWFWILVLIITASAALDVSLPIYLSDCLQKIWDMILTRWILLAMIILLTVVMCFCCLKPKSRFKGSKGVSFSESVPKIEGTNCIDVDKLPEPKTLEKKGKPFLIRREPKE